MRTTTGFWSVLLSFWAGLLFSVIYGVVGYVVIRISVGVGEASSAAQFFVFGYGGLITGTACTTLFLMSIYVLRLVPTLIERAIPAREVIHTKYSFWKARLESFPLGLAQFTTYFVGGFAIYSLLGFPVATASQPVFVAFSSLQYAFGGFVGRKLWCIGHMLRSLEDVQPNDDLLEIEALPRLIYIINIFTFLTLAMTAIHTYFHADVTYELQSDLAKILQPLVYLPIILALPVTVLFNFYPRMVTNHLYLKSIHQRKVWLANKMQDSKESEIVQFRYIIDYEKYLNEEFRHRQRVALSELPVALTVAVSFIVAIIHVLFK